MYLLVKATCTSYKTYCLLEIKNLNLSISVMSKKMSA